jgi:hypothetical protein
MEAGVELMQCSMWPTRQPPMYEACIWWAGHPWMADETGSGPAVSVAVGRPEDAIDTVTIPQVTGGPLCYTKIQPKKT